MALVSWRARSLCVAAIWWAGLDKMYDAATLKDCAEIGIGQWAGRGNRQAGERSENEGGADFRR